MFKQFIHRPVLAISISTIIVALGLLALFKLPVMLFPSVAPPGVYVTIEYTGANAETVIRTGIVPLEKAINGVPGMKYMSSDAANDGIGVIQVIFETGTDPDVAAVNVQNRVNSVISKLPAEIIRNGIKITKEESAILMYLNIYSTDTTLDQKFLYNFADINLLEELKRVKGVGYIDILGAKEYAMRIWLKPDKMISFNISAQDVMDAIEEHNVEAAPGKIGESSEKEAQSLQYTIKYTGKFSKPEAYEQIPLKATGDGRILKIKDIADVEFGTTYFDVESKLDGKPSAAIIIKQLPGTNSTEVIQNIKKRMELLKETTFLKGMDYKISFDTSLFLDAAIEEVIKTLIEAFILVSLVVFIFLQDWRSTLIPVLSVPVSLIGTFFIIQFLGFSLNMITLFAIVLAIGIVVDNAIVIVEAVHAKMEKYHQPPGLATESAMEEITGVIIAITLVMSAVFIPVSFASGPSGIFFRQFCLTIAIAIVISGVVALTLAPALCALLLKQTHTVKVRKNVISIFLNGFNSWYINAEKLYESVLNKIIRNRLLILGSLVLFTIFSVSLAMLLPSGFIPSEDQGIFYASITTPAGATLERTKEVVDKIQRIGATIKAVASISSLAGANVLHGTGATYGTCIINLVSWEKRKESVEDIINIFKEKTQHIKGAKIEYFPPPVVPGYGVASGFELRLLDKTRTEDYKRMEVVLEQFINDLKMNPEIGSVFSVFDAGFPEYTIEIDLDKAAQKGITPKNALSSLQILLGSEYASNFIRFGQMYKVMVQALPKYRALPEQLLSLYVKNKDDEMVPLSAIMRVKKSYGLIQVTRYNMFPCAEINGEGKPGVSSGTALKVIQKTAKERLPAGYEIDWAGISKDEANVGNEFLYIFIICFLFVYLILCGQYESFLLPLPVLFSLPTGIFGAYFFLMLLGLENNIYSQIAMIMLIGMLGKNAILIVEFAIIRNKEGLPIVAAALEAAKLRLRPILMTSFAFIGGLIPLVFAGGAGAMANQTIGAAAAGGMLTGTLFGLLVIPGLYVMTAGIIQRPIETFKPHVNDTSLVS
jgi:HAE1 family hydrophobic/amphiphilic exporter-1